MLTLIKSIHQEVSCQRDWKKKNVPIKIFLSKFCKILKNKIFTEYLWATAPVNARFIKDWICFSFNHKV